MRPGMIIAERFEVVSRAGAGGMGVVYRARDRSSGADIALKVLHDASGDGATRFSREARALSRLAHPAIVAYVAHGETPDGESFLAMEWLEGEDLSARLAREGLSIADAITVGVRIAEALDVAHRDAVLHRDIKPSNVYLTHGRPELAKVLDFGVARLVDATRIMTGTGAMIGSVGYMSPEQVQGSRQIDARADVYSLGCVLFEAIAGRAAFVGDHPVSILVQALHDRPPPLLELRPEAPSAVAALVDSMLARDPAERPASARAVVESLSALGPLTGSLAPRPVRRRPSVSGGERRMVSVILVRFAEAPTVVEGAMITPGTTKPASTAGLQNVVAPLGGHVVTLRSGVVLVLQRGSRVAKDEAARAAACALAIRAAFPDAKVAVATGSAEVSGRWAGGPVVDRAAAILDATEDASRQHGLRDEESRATGVRIDDVTAGLLDVRFSVHGAAGAKILASARAFAAESRKVLGKPTQCVGRERELAFLEATWSSCVDDEEARAVTVVGPAGMGKSRLRREIVARLAARDDLCVAIARADSLAAGSAYHVAGQLVRSVGALSGEGEPAEQRAALSLHLDALFEDAEERCAAAEFLSEMLRIGDADDPSKRLRAARNDPRILGEQIRAAFVSWLGRLTRAKPTLVVVEDLHWADPSSVALIQSAREALRDSPWMTLALTRPADEGEAPALPDAEQLILSPLSKRAAERLVKSLLGDDASAASVARIVERADGNPFFLEEIVRHVAEHGQDSLPETVMAMVQSRIEGLEAHGRLVLRVASVFGETFWQDGVAALLRDALPRQDVSAWLDVLVRQEIIAPGRGERFSGARELVFRHAILRDVAYAMLVDSDRTACHRVAGEWLEDAGERDNQVLAEHFLRGQAPERAAPRLYAAARSCLSGADLAGAVSLADKGLACAPADDGLRGGLQMVRGLALGWRDEWADADASIEAALTLLPPGSAEWTSAAAIAILGAGRRGDPAAIFALKSRFDRLDGAPEPTGPYAFTMFMMAITFAQLGQRQIAIALDERLDQAGSGTEGHDPAFEGWREVVRAVVCDKPRGEMLGEALAASRAAAAALEEAGDMLGLGVVGGWLARCLSLAGDQGAAEVQARATLDLIDRTKNFFTRKRAAGVLGSVLVHAGRADEGIEVLNEVLSGGDMMASLFARVELARGLVAKGELDRAEQEARAAAEAAGLFFAPHQAGALTLLAHIRMLRGDAAEALETTRRARQLAETGGLDVLTRSGIDSTEITALRALGQDAEADALLGRARARVELVAAGLPEELRAAWRAQPDNRVVVA